MVAFTYIAKRSGGGWKANRISSEEGDLSAEASDTFELQKELKKLSIDNSNGGAVQTLLSTISKDTLIFQVNVGGAVAAGGGGGAGPAAAGGGGGESAAEEKKEEKEEEEEEEDEGQGPTVAQQSMRPQGAPGDVEMGVTTTPQAEPADKFMDEFFKEVSLIKGIMAGIRRNENALEEAHERSKTVTRSEEMKQIREKMQDDIDEVNKTAHQVKTRLERLDKLNQQSLSRPNCGPGSSSERTRTAITAALRRKLKDLMGDFQDLRQRLTEEYREVVERRVYTVTGQKASADEVDKMIETGESESIFQKAILEQGRGHALDTLAEIQERHEAVKELERSLLDLHQIFLDMAVLVEAQGEMLDNIEAQVAKSVEYVASGTTALVEAKRLQKNTRKLMCFGLIILAIIIIIIIIVVLVAIKPWK